MYTVPEHIWRTKDGDLVPNGHRDAAFLAYAKGDELTDHDADQRGVRGVYEEKSRRKPADKAVRKPADKAAGEETEI